MLSPNAKAVISLSLLALAQPATMLFLRISGITAEPHVAEHKFWELKAAVLELFRGLASVAPRIYSTYLYLCRAISTPNSLQSATLADLRILGLAAVVLSLWIIPLSLSRGKDTRDTMQVSFVKGVVFAYATISVVSILSTVIWGYTPSPVFWMYGLVLRRAWTKVDDGGGTRETDEESLKEPVGVDVGQLKELSG